MNNAAAIIDFMKIVEKLCAVMRDSRLRCGAPESDADHILKLCWLVMLVTPYLKVKLDSARMLELALVHDLVEAWGGDFSLSAQEKHPELAEIKKQKEREAIEHYRTLLPEPLGEKIYNLFMEFENKSSREAQVVWVLDRIDGNLQANFYHDGDVRYWADCDGGEYYYSYTLSGNTRQKKCLEFLNEDILLQLENAVLNLGRENMRKCGIKI